MVDIMQNFEYVNIKNAASFCYEGNRLCIVWNQVESLSGDAMILGYGKTPDDAVRLILEARNVGQLRDAAELIGPLVRCTWKYCDEISLVPARPEEVADYFGIKKTGKAVWEAKQGLRFGKQCMIEDAADFLDVGKALALAVNLQNVAKKAKLMPDELKSLGVQFEWERVKGAVMGDGREVDGFALQSDLLLSLDGNLFEKYHGSVPIDPFSFGSCVVDGVLKIRDSIFSETKRSINYSEIAKRLFDALVSGFLTDVRLFTCNGGTETKSIPNAFSAIWMGLVDDLREGRAGRCVVCGRPFIAKGERGKRRKYCSSACNKWSQSHPGETR